MTTVSDNVLDNGLNYLTTKAAKIHLCSAKPAAYAGVAAVSLAHADVNIGAPKNANPSGREVVIPAPDQAYTVTSDGNATHYAITDGAGELLIAKALATPQAIYVANAVSTPEASVRFPDPA